jgi:polyphosphate kinase 2 (PPK2 family)
MSANLRQANTRAWERCMRKKHNRSKESDSRLSPVVAGKHKALCLGRDCDYPKELRRLQIELVKLQEWGRHKGLRVVALFEGRDAAGKGGAIKRITESLNPRICRVVACSRTRISSKLRGTW